MTNKSFISRLFNFGAPQSGSNTGVFLAANHAWVFRPENDDQRALCHSYPLHKDDWNSLFAAVYADFGPSKLQLALGFGRYQLLSADRPKVEADEMAQALVWAVKDMVSTPPTDIHLDYFESPIKSSDKLNVVVCSHSRLSALAQEIDKAGMQLVGISIEELLPTNLFNQDPLARLVISQVPGQELLLTVVREGELYMQRRIRGFAELHQTDAESLGFGVADTLSLEIQRSMDFFESQLRQAPVASIEIMVQGQTYALAQLVSRNFNQQVRPVDGMDVGMRMAELSYQELERGSK
ncbi:MSHA biogenesis protein MshI [Shewanella chilikensis]|uniref:MSHA biogenesis protein MshI n=1 Tax=Shewanella chilikensis TaxID=558541 RepID=UPI001F2624CC|nr:MSHA biogenesis protein MshI [Shewanella chilikensis]MCE9787953.1 MSHA biogenesis protein MshI [Shewanella chilikensis]